MAKKLTDEDILSRDRLTTHEAASYLGKSWWDLTEGIKNGSYKFGTATRNPSGKYTYTIYANQVYKFKHGIYDVDQQQYSDLMKKLTEATDLMCQCVSLMETLVSHMIKDNAT